jgi:hypothetical protein
MRWMELFVSTSTTRGFVLHLRMARLACGARAVAARERWASVRGRRGVASNRRYAVAHASTDTLPTLRPVTSWVAVRRSSSLCGVCLAWPLAFDIEKGNA